MKKVILTVIAVVVGFIGFAQDNANTSNQDENINTLVDFRMTNSMDKSEVELELINNFFKIELSDLMQNDDLYFSKNSDKKVDNSILSKESKEAMANGFTISDIAVRTTINMRPSLYSTEEITA